MPVYLRRFDRIVSGQRLPRLALLVVLAAICTVATPAGVAHAEKPKHADLVLQAADRTPRVLLSEVLMHPNASDEATRAVVAEIFGEALPAGEKTERLAKGLDVIRAAQRRYEPELTKHAWTGPAARAVKFRDRYLEKEREPPHHHVEQQLAVFLADELLAELRHHLQLPYDSAAFDEGRDELFFWLEFAASNAAKRAPRSRRKDIAEVTEFATRAATERTASAVQRLSTRVDKTYDDAWRRNPKEARENAEFLPLLGVYILRAERALRTGADAYLAGVAPGQSPMAKPFDALTLLNLVAERTGLPLLDVDQDTASFYLIDDLLKIINEHRREWKILKDGKAYGLLTEAQWLELDDKLAALHQADLRRKLIEREVRLIAIDYGVDPGGISDSRLAELTALRDQHRQQRAASSSDRVDELDAEHQRRFEELLFRHPRAISVQTLLLEEQSLSPVDPDADQQAFLATETDPRTASHLSLPAVIIAEGGQKPADVVPGNGGQNPAPLLEGDGGQRPAPLLPGNGGQTPAPVLAGGEGCVSWTPSAGHAQASAPCAGPTGMRDASTIDGIELALADWGSAGGADPVEPRPLPPTVQTADESQSAREPDPEIDGEPVREATELIEPEPGTLLDSPLIQVDPEQHVDARYALGYSDSDIYREDHPEEFATKQAQPDPQPEPQIRLGGSGRIETTDLRSVQPTSTPDVPEAGPTVVRGGGFGFLAD